jgi:hypothetical protein
MSRVEELERAIQELPPDEFAQIARRIYGIEQERWEGQLDRDAKLGKLDFLVDEARKDQEAALLKDWPPSA